MGTIFENAAATIAARGKEASGCDCTYKAQGADPGVPVKAQVRMKPVEMRMPGMPGRGVSAIPIGQNSTKVFVMVDAGSEAGQVAKLAADDYLVVPGAKVGRPADATVTIKIGGKPQLVEGKYWTAEASL